MKNMCSRASYNYVKYMAYMNKLQGILGKEISSHLFGNLLTGIQFGN